MPRDYTRRVPRVTDPVRVDPPKDETFPIKLTRGYFPMSGGDKLQPGSVVHLKRAEARHVVAIGAGIRMDIEL